MVLPATLDPNGPLDDTYGAMYIGILLSAILYGVCILQVFQYFLRYPKDLWYLKTIVITLITFDTTHMFFLGSLVYHYAIRNYHDPSKLPYLVWQIPGQAMFVMLNGAIVQVFSVYRLFRLSQSKPLCAFILILVFCQVGTGTSWVILTWQKKTYSDLSEFVPIAITMTVLSCGTDILIVGSLCFFLYRARTGFKRSDTLINKLILFVISTGALTTIFAIISFIFMFARPWSLLYSTFYFCLGRLYTNSLLATLNARLIIGDSSELDLCSTMPKGTRGAMSNIDFLVGTTTHPPSQERGETTSASESMAMKARFDVDDDSLPKREGGL